MLATPDLYDPTEEGISEKEALERGLREKSIEFVQKEAEVYEKE